MERGRGPLAPAAADCSKQTCPALPIVCGHANARRQQDIAGHGCLAEILSPSSPLLNPRIAYRRRPDISSSCHRDQSHAIARMQFAGLIDRLQECNQGDGAGQDCGRAWATIRSPKRCPIPSPRISASFQLAAEPTGAASLVAHRDERLMVSAIESVCVKRSRAKMLGVTKFTGELHCLSSARCHLSRRRLIQRLRGGLVVGLSTMSDI